MTYDAIGTVRRALPGIALGLLLVIASGPVAAQLQFEAPPISYGTAPFNDRITRLQQQVDAGEVRLEFDSKLGYLPAVLKALEIPASSQMLVFSQTSFQLRKISPSRPRAVYFSDDTYVGWVQFGDVVELSTVDPQQGAVFYTLDQEPVDRPVFVRDRGQCLTCHASSRTQGVPGHLVRSVYPDASGRPQLGSGTYTTDHASPFKHRWGGWYVSGTHGDLRHMGNVIARNRRDPDMLDTESGANHVSLRDLVDTEPYLQPHSDIVALMVLEHQTQMHNFLTLANFEARHAMYYNQVMNEALERSDDHVSESTQRRIDSAAEKLVRYLLFVDEFELTSPIQGVSGFAEEFAARGPVDTQGRSLRQLQLQGRLFKYPCSYLIYSEAFDGLPAVVKRRVYQRLHAILSGQDTSNDFAHLTPADRRAIRDILHDTKPEAKREFARLDGS